VAGLPLGICLPSLQDLKARACRPFRWSHVIGGNLMKKLMRTRSVLMGFALLGASLGGVSATQLLSSTPAAASGLGNVYVAYPTWGGNCPGGGSVVGIYAASGDLWATGSGGDWGDDLIYPRVELDAWNTISAQLWCRTGWYTYLSAAYAVSVFPTRPGETFWAAVGGQTWHN